MNKTMNIPEGGDAMSTNRFVLALSEIGIAPLIAERMRMQQGNQTTARQTAQAVH